MAQVRPVTSEALEAQIRELLPSQNGFTEDLQASNVITPIIDLTRAAEGSTTPVQLQEALSFTDVTVNTFQNNSGTCINQTGFWLVEYQCSLSALNARGRLQLDDGLAQKTIVDLRYTTDKGGLIANRLTVFLTAGDSLIGLSTTTGCILNVTTRQIADVNGNLVEPTGFTPQ